MLIFAHPYTFFITIPLLLAAVWYRTYWYKPIRYVYPLAAWLQYARSNVFLRYLFFAVRAFSLMLLSFLIAQPQLVDVDTTVHGEGVALMMVLDVSGSMQLVDDPRNTHAQTRLQLAKAEAIRFIDKRQTDQIGLVLFGQEAMARVPLTLDKKILKEVIDELHIGVIPENGTVLSKGMILAAARLQPAPAVSKVMIVLTDGQPSPHDDAPQTALAIAKKLGIKIYTIGIGGDVGYRMIPGYGVVAEGAALNKELLQHIARETGGRFFEANRQHELRAIYDQIDSLEKSAYTTTVFSNYRDIFIPFVWLVIGLMALEIFLSTLVWALL